MYSLKMKIMSNCLNFWICILKLDIKQKTFDMCVEDRGYMLKLI